MLLELMKLKEYWAYYYVSGGKWYAEELAEVRDLLCEHATQLFELDPNRAPPTSKALNLYSLSDIVAVLEHWDIDGGKFPLETDVGSCWWIGGLGELHFTLVGLAGIPKQFLPRLAYTSGVTLLAESMIALRYHLPKHLNVAQINTADDAIRAISTTQCIALFGDIRNSQDLMYHTQPPEDFFSRLFSFTSKATELASAHGGIFDKFTGDGFL